MIYFHIEDVLLPKLEKRKVKKWIARAINSEKRKLGNVNYVFCSDEYLLNINRKYLKHNFYTDVITFNYVENNIINGDIYISIERVKENAKNLKITFMNELNRVMIHGILHLIGYDDKSENDKVKMTKMENKYLRLLNE